ncbi:MAG: HPr(Ser) kinase/phosphatase [Oscillospiraceae bacterium]|nr:HPr(Ser) kinase/phosphatase [Oscillospiraceae bacterium]
MDNIENIDNVENIAGEPTGESYSVSLVSLVKFLRLTEVFMPENKSDIQIRRKDVNRPGLPFAGFYDSFEADRIQIIGKTEHKYLQSLGGDKRAKCLKNFFSTRPICAVFTTDLPVFDEAMRFAQEENVPILATADTTSAFMAALIAKLNLELAPRIGRHGVFVEIYGEGVLILGESGIGKSETAIELVKRGHRLIADDLVEIRKVSAITLLGTAPENIRHYIVLRGIGIVDVKRIFGMGAVKMIEKVDLVIKLEDWVQGASYEQFGLENNYVEIMGIPVPSLTIPVKPGRNLAIILEVAAMNNRQKKMGYDTAAEMNNKLMGQHEQI